MKTIIEYKTFFAYSENKSKSFYTEFSPIINIIHGKNTSGKSTLIQAIHYTFGINDEKHKLAEVLSENVIFRLDITIKNKSNENITIIRDDEFIYIKRQNQPIIKFSGISGNTAKEHILLKKYFGELFGFKLNLETSGEYKLASLEALFLPYYVAQDYGWVLALKSFRGLDFFRNFKTDYYDYYLGITNEFDRIEKQKRENEKSEYENEIKFLSQNEQKNDEIKLSKLKDESFISKSLEYINTYKSNKEKLIIQEKEYLLYCNKFTFLEERLKVLKKVKTAHKKQKPFENDCPTCHQNLPNSLETVYEYFQDSYNTLEEIDKIIFNLKSLKGTINSLEEKNVIQKDVVAKDYAILLQYKIEDLSFNTWLDNKTNVQLSKNILLQIGKTQLKLDESLEQLKGFKTDNDLKNERNLKDYLFQSYFKSYLVELGVKPFENDLYTLLYKMKIFPKQGVELLETLLAYYFAFNKIIEKTDYIHRLPFMMDAVFKEDIDETNRKQIIEFIYKHKPIDTQIIFSIAESKDNSKTASYYNKELMNNEANLIMINTIEKRAFLSEFDNQRQNYLDETLNLIE
jgi:hypothetical protein